MPPPAEACRLVKLAILRNVRWHGGRCERDGGLQVLGAARLCREQRMRLQSSGVSPRVAPVACVIHQVFFQAGILRARVPACFWEGMSGGSPIHEPFSCDFSPWASSAMMWNRVRLMHEPFSSGSSPRLRSEPLFRSDGSRGHDQAEASALTWWKPLLRRKPLLRPGISFDPPASISASTSATGLIQALILAQLHSRPQPSNSQNAKKRKF